MGAVIYGGLVSHAYGRERLLRARPAAARASAGGLLATALLLGGFAAAILRPLRPDEIMDRPDDLNPPLDKMKVIAALENHPRYAQNHFTGGDAAEARLVPLS